MNSLPKNLLIIAVITSHLHLHAETPDRLFYDAVRSEASGDFVSAIDSYEKAAAISHSANLHGNLANLYFKMDDHGRSILNYRKALLLDPSNREFSANLAFVSDIAGLQKDSPFSDGYIGSQSYVFWVVVTPTVIWGGLLVLGVLFFRRWAFDRVPWFGILWIVVCAISTWALKLSRTNQLLLSREVIALTDARKENNQSNEIALRRFAVANSSANTTVKSGESLFLDKDQDGTFKTHKSQSGTRWYLLRTKDSRKKGWVEEREIGWVRQKPVI
tara:strand:- start:896 stop:1717 length:822 start_codon:yes stop_codon:yes gene_type:complete